MSKQKVPAIISDLHIGVPPTGDTTITIKRREEDQSTISILIENNGKAVSYSWTRFNLPEEEENSIIIKFKDGTLLKEE